MQKGPNNHIEKPQSERRLVGKMNEEWQLDAIKAEASRCRKITRGGKGGSEVGEMMSHVADSGVSLDPHSLAIAKQAQDAAQEFDLSPELVGKILRDYGKAKANGALPFAGEPETHAHKPKKKPAKALVRAAVGSCSAGVAASAR